MEAQPPNPPSPLAGRVRSRPDPFLITCRCFSIITSLSAILCIAVNVLSAVRSFKDGSAVFAPPFFFCSLPLQFLSPPLSSLVLVQIFDGIFRCYAVVIAVFVVVAETEWEFVMKFSKVLEYWAGRGMLQIFVAVMTRAYPEYLRNNQDLFLLQSISSYLLLACGVVYIVSGLFCIGMVKRARQKKEISREQAIKDLEDLERRREELESLLVPGEP